MLSVADTAFSIAVVRAEEASHPASARLFDDPYAHLFAAAGGHAAEGTARYLALPFFRDGIRLRTRYLDDGVRAGLEAGLAQIVLLGAGFDARGLRLPEVSAAGANVFEVDFAEQLATKRAILAGAGLELPAHLHHVPCDFTRPGFEGRLAEGLGSRGYRAGAGAIFVWEGVVGYIDDEAIDRSLRFVADVGGPGSRLLFTSGDGSFGAEGAAARMRRFGFDACEELGLDGVWQRYLPGPPHAHAWVSRVGTAIVAGR